MEMQTKTPVTYDNVLAHLQANATVATAANFKAIAAGTLAYMVGFVWADKKEAKPAADIKADILRMFGDDGKSKKYEFAGLCLTIARGLAKGHAWGAEMAQQDSVETGVTFLADRFASVASSVAALARHFGTERSGGNRKAKPFLEGLEKLLESAVENGESIPVGPAIMNLIRFDAPSADDSGAIIDRLVSIMSDESIADMITRLNNILVQRQHKAPIVPAAPAMTEAAMIAA